MTTHQRRWQRIALTLWLALAAAGCATVPESEVFDPQAQWEQGRRQVEKGEADLHRAQQRLENGRALVRDGEAIIQLGSKTVEEARRAYQSKSLGGGGSTSPKQIKYESQTLKDIARRWEDGLDQIKNGNGLVAKGNKSLEQGQREVRSARLMIDAGATLMRKSERALREAQDYNQGPTS